MAHPVADGLVEVIEVVTPGTYWIRCARCSGFSKVPNCIRRKPYSGEFHPQNFTEVFVRDRLSDFFYRGVVLGRRESSKPPFWTFVVQLVDTHQIKEFHNEDVYPNFGETNDFCERGHLVSLDGVLPSLPPSTIDLHRWTSFERDARTWDEMKPRVIGMFSDHEPLNFYYKNVRSIAGHSYCMLSYDAHHTTNLVSKLANQNLAHHIERDFESAIRALRHPVNVDKLPPAFAPNLVSIPCQLNNHDVSHSDKGKYISANDIYDLNKFRVHEDDRKLHASLAKGFHVNVLLTEHPQQPDAVIVRYVAPNGDTLLGTVEELNINYTIALPLYGDDQDLRNWSREQFGINETGSDTSECSSIPNDEIDQTTDERWYNFNFGNVLKLFRAQGGVIEGFYDVSNDALAPFANFVELAFDAMGITELREWQKICLPSLLAKHDTLIIGPEGEGKLSLALIAVMTLLNRVNVETAQLKGPVIVVVVPNSSRAERVFDFITKLADFEVNVLISMSTFVSEKQKAQVSSGCDILISNPKNFVELMNTKCLPPLGSSDDRLSHVVFDSLESLNRNYEKHLGLAYKVLNCSEVKQKAQIVSLSHKWGSYLLGYIEGLPVRCITDLVAATFSYGLLPTVIPYSVDNWAVQLMRIWEENQHVGKRLLLCRDVDVSATQELVTFNCPLVSCRSIQETLQKDEISKNVAWWRTTPNALLICSDSVFQAYDVADDVCLLISFKGVDNRDALNRRYKAIGGHQANERRFRARVFLFYDPDNFDEVVFFKNLVDNVAHLEETNDKLSQILSRIGEDRDANKTTKLCSNVFSFGACADAVKCPYRHTFRDEDTVKMADGHHFFIVELLKVHSSCHYSTRMKEIVSNDSRPNQAGLRVSTLPAIDAHLQKSFSMKQRPEKICPGDVFGATLGPVLRRVQVLNCGQDDCEVKLMDFDEPDTRLRLEDLFIIPFRIAANFQDKVDVYVTGLKPPDPNCDWAYESRCFTGNLIELIKSDDCRFLAGPVVAQLNRNILVESMRLVQYNENVIVEKLSLKDATLEEKIACRNDDHLNLLFALADRCGKSPLKRNFLGAREDLPEGFVLAEVSSYESPGAFYIQLLDERDDLAEFERALDDCLRDSRIPLRIIARYEFCAVSVDGKWNRAIVHDLSDDKAFVLFVDYGDVQHVPHSELFQLPHQFLSVRYFAIECSLLGIKPTDDVYSDEAVELFRSFVRTEDDLMKTVSVRFGPVTPQNQIPQNFLSYQVVMKDPTQPEGSLNFNFLFCERAAVDPTTINILKTTSN